MQLKKAVLHMIEMPLKKPFSTHLETVKKRRAIIVELADSTGLTGLGEVSAFSSPWYTEETVTTSLHILKDFLIPLLGKQKISHPREIAKLFSAVKKNPMAKAGLEGAIWDLYARQNQQSLRELIGGLHKQVPAGAVVAALDPLEAQEQVEQFIEEGYTRIKLKLDPVKPHRLVEEIRNKFPSLSLAADANAAFTIDDLDLLKSLDQFDLLFIEEPLQAENYIDYQVLQKNLKTPIALDESITSFMSARQAVELGSCKAVNIKVSRVGGLCETLAIHDYCISQHIPLMSGGMIEFGVSRAHTLIVASLAGFTIPGDLSAANRFWVKDIVTEEAVIENGWIKVPEGPGIGVELDRKRLKEVTLEKFIIDL
jgi:O-succinylbenzoate synthase